MDHVPERVNAVVIDLDGLVLALLGGLLVPHVAGDFLDQAGAGPVHAEYAGGEQGRHVANPVGDLVLRLGEVRESVLVRLPDERCGGRDRKSTRLNSSHVKISYAVFCLKKKKKRAQGRTSRQ